MKPAIDSLADGIDNNALIGTLDVDVNPRATAKYGVRNLPTFLIFKEEDLRETIVGCSTKIIAATKAKCTTMINNFFSWCISIAGFMAIAVLSYYLNIPVDFKGIISYTRNHINERG